MTCHKRSARTTRTFILAVMLSMTAHAFGQGYLNFANVGGGAGGMLNAPVTNATVVPAVRANGNTALAMLYIGPAGTSDMFLLTTNGVEGPPSYFATGGQAGYFLGGKRAISGYNPGDIITAQVRYWIASESPNWESAFSKAVTELIQIRLSDVAATPTNLVGIRGTVIVLPGLIVYVTNQTVVAGSDAYLFTSVFGSSPPYFYQWRFHGTNLPGATSSVLTRTNAQAADAGTYSVLVSSCCTSGGGAGTLQVLVPARLTELQSFPNSFSFSVTGTTGANYVVQSATTLVPTNWTPRLTNVAPFIFTESNSQLQPQRFYRALLR
jgi:hypothetical protein